MNTHNSILDSASRESVVPERILRTALAALRQGDFVEVVDQFNDQFTFIDHALEPNSTIKNDCSNPLPRRVNSSRIP